jgi:hypothetical protein
MFDSAPSFSDSLAAVKGKDGKYGYIDKAGNFIIQPQFDEVSPFCEGLAPVLFHGDQTRSLAYLDNKGQVVIKSLFPLPDAPQVSMSYFSFCGGVARVGIGQQGDHDYECELPQPQGAAIGVLGSGFPVECHRDNPQKHVFRHAIMVRHL